MNHDQGPADEILNLWPTLFARAVLGEPDHATPGLAELGIDGVVAGDLFAHDADCVAWLRGRLEAMVGIWLERLDAGQPAWRLRGSLEVFRFGDYRELGNAPGAYLAGTYFVNEPAAPELDHVRSDCHPSRMTFYDPRVAFNSLAIQGDPYFLESIMIVPEPGLVLMWPGYVRHFTRVHLSHEPWVRVDFRVELGGDAA